MPAGSIMVTGSHNPRDDNGFKILQNGKSFFGTQIQDLLAKILNSHVMPTTPYVIPAKAGIHNIQSKYLKRILDGISINPKLKVAWDSVTEHNRQYC